MNQNCYNAVIKKSHLILNSTEKIKTSKAVGIDELPARLLKDLSGVVAKPLTTLINLSLFSETKK